MTVLPLKPREVPVPLPGQAISVVLSLAATTVLTNFLTQRALAIKIWRRLPLVVWLVFAIYTDSYLFVSATAILQHTFGVNSSLSVCRGAILLCLVCYVSTKFIYLFLVEKAHIIRGTPKRRLQSKLYIFNSFGMLGVYIVVVILNFVFRITRMQNGQCIIGMKSVAMIPLISFDAVVNVYLTIMFLIPLKNLYSFKNMPRTQANIRLRTVAFRTFVGALCTLLSSIINLSVLMALDGEPGWVCLMCCNCDILFSAMVIQWVTSKDNAGTSSATSSGGTGRAGRVPAPGQNRDSGGSTIHSFPLRQTHHSAPTTPGDYFLGSRRSGSQSDVADQHDSTDHSIKHDANGSRAVIVTTTIKRESVLASDDDLQSLERSFDSSADDGEAKPIRAGMHRASGASVWPEAMFGPRTTVAAGTSSSPTKPHISRSYFDARAEPFAKGQDR